MLQLWPWKTIRFLLSRWWSSVPSCMTLKHTVQSLSCLQGFSTKWCYSLDLSPLTLKNNRVPPILMVIKCTKLYDPEAYGSVSIPPTSFSTKWCYSLDLWPLTLIINRVPPLMMMIKLYDPEAYDSVSILPTSSGQTDRQTDIQSYTSLKTGV